MTDEGHPSSVNRESHEMDVETKMFGCAGCLVALYVIGFIAFWVAVLYLAARAIGVLH